MIKTSTIGVMFKLLHSNNKVLIYNILSIFNYMSYSNEGEIKITKKEEFLNDFLKGMFMYKDDLTLVYNFVWLLRNIIHFQSSVKNFILRSNILEFFQVVNNQFYLDKELNYALNIAISKLIEKDPLPKYSEQFVKIFGIVQNGLNQIDFEGITAALKCMIKISRQPGITVEIIKAGIHKTVFDLFWNMSRYNFTQEQNKIFKEILIYIMGVLCWQGNVKSTKILIKDEILKIILNQIVGNDIPIRKDCLWMLNNIICHTKKKDYKLFMEITKTIFDVTVQIFDVINGGSNTNNIQGNNPQIAQIDPNLNTGQIQNNPQMMNNPQPILNMNVMNNPQQNQPQNLFIPEVQNNSPNEIQLQQLNYPQNQIEYDQMIRAFNEGICTICSTIKESEDKDLINFVDYGKQKLLQMLYFALNYFENDNGLRVNILKTLRKICCYQLVFDQLEDKDGELNDIHYEKPTEPILDYDNSLENSINMDNPLENQKFSIDCIEELNKMGMEALIDKLVNDVCKEVSETAEFYYTTVYDQVNFEENIYSQKEESEEEDSEEEDEDDVHSEEIFQ
ncbi:MAG: hypothetical protein MJ252_20825 [archaeon]|nr:hypothetical protein [archaeon]